MGTEGNPDIVSGVEEGKAIIITHHVRIGRSHRKAKKQLSHGWLVSNVSCKPQRDFQPRPSALHKKKNGQRERKRRPKIDSSLPQPASADVWYNRRYVFSPRPRSPVAGDVVGKSMFYRGKKRGSLSSFGSWTL